MLGRLALCTNPWCREAVRYTAGREAPPFCTACRREYAAVTEPAAVTARPTLPKSGRVLPHFLDDTEHW